jgi:hypothetical protein
MFDSMWGLEDAEQSAVFDLTLTSTSTHSYTEPSRHLLIWGFKYWLIPFGRVGTEGVWQGETRL